MTPSIPGPAAAGPITLRRAARRGDTDAVRRILASGVRPDDGRALLSPLALAARAGADDVVELLLGHGADPGWTSHDGWTAATFADAEGFGELAQRIVTAGAPPGSPRAHGYGSLHRAARRGDVDVLRRHARTGQLDPLDAQGDTPLVLAIRHRNEQAADLLVAAGADPNHLADGWSVLAEAAYQDSVLDRSTTFVDPLLTAGADPNPAGYPPLLCAVNQEGSSAGVLRRLVAAGADVAATGADGETVLHRIAGLAGAALVDAALDAGAPIDARDDRGRTPLLAAADAANGATFRRLAERGADTDARDLAGRTATELLDPPAMP
jgi:ankyrin repeat protein